MNGQAAPRAALAAWAIKPAVIEPLAGGSVNEHWRVESDSGEVFALRRYRQRHANTDPGFEHEVLDFLAGRHWPVAPAVPSRGNETVVALDSGRWALFPFLPGSVPPATPRLLQRKGAVLALLHADLREWSPAGQRRGFGRVTDLDTYVRPDGFTSLADLLAWYADADPERAEALGRMRADNLAALDDLGYESEPQSVVYYECLGNNVLFEGDEVTALLDWDFVHLDARTVDVARSVVIDCGGTAAQVGAWLAGYAAHAEPPLSETEARLLPALMVACEIWNTVLPLSISAAANGEAEWMLRSARDSIDTRLPRLVESQAILAEVARLATAGRG